MEVYDAAIAPRCRATPAKNSWRRVGRSVRMACVTAAAVAACLLLLAHTRTSNAFEGLSSGVAPAALTRVSNRAGAFSSGMGLGCRKMAEPASRSMRYGVRASMDDENRDAYKQVILEYVKDGFASESVDAWRNDINEMLYRLEPLNPTPEPAYSKLLQGEWDFSFVGSMAQGILASPTREIALLLYAGGYTPGRFGIDVASRLPKNVLDVKSIKLKVQETAPTGSVTTSVKLPGNRDLDLTVATNLEPESDFTMSETYQSLNAMGRAFDLPAQLKSKRRFYIRYLDDDLLVVRDDTGVADVLTRSKVEEVVAAAVPEAAAEEGAMMSFDTPTAAPTTIEADAIEAADE